MYGINIRAATALVLAAPLLLACVQPPALVVEDASGEIVPLESWSADLTSAAAGPSLKGNVLLVPGSNVRETRALVTLAGGTPGAVYPWYVQLGDCANDRGILASLMVYPPIALDASGEAKATATLPFTLPTSGRYFVSVRQSETAVSTIIACGNLTRTGDSASQKVGYVRTP